MASRSYLAWVATMGFLPAPPVGAASAATAASGLKPLPQIEPIAFTLDQRGVAEAP